MCESRVALTKGINRMAIREALTQQTYTAGRHVSAGAAITAGDNRVALICQRVAWRDVAQDVIRCVVEVSRDGGVIWKHLGGFTAWGKSDPAPGFDGDPSISLPLVSPGDNCKLRVVMDALEDIETKVDIESFDDGTERQQGNPPESVSFDAVASTNFAGVSSVNWSHTSSGTPTGVGIGVQNANSVNPASISTVTFDGVTCTDEVTLLRTPNTSQNSAIWGLTSPNSGTVTVVVTFDNGSNFGVAGSVTVVGGNTSTLFSNTNTGFGTTGDASLTVTSATGELVMDSLVSVVTVTAAVGSGQTERWNLAGGVTRGVCSTEVGAASVAMDWTLTGNEDFQHVGASFKAAAAGGLSTKTRYVNNTQTTLNGAINSSVTSVTVVDGGDFPQEGDFFVLIDEETMRVTAVATNVLTVVRGVEGTSDVSHGGGTVVIGISCQSMLTEYHRQHWVHGTDSPAFTVTDPVIGLRANVADFTFVNQGSATASDRNDGIFMKVPLNASGEQFRGLFITAPTPPYAVIMAFNLFTEAGGTGLATTPFPQGGLYFRENSTGELMTILSLKRLATETRPWSLQVETMDSPTVLNTSKYHQLWAFGEGPTWFKIEDDNTDLKFSVGPNGLDWIEIFSEGRTLHMAGGPDEVGFGINLSGNNAYEGMMEILHFGLEEL